MVYTAFPVIANLAACDSMLAARLMHNFERDLGQSMEITYDAWRNRASFCVYERAGGMLERQQ